MEIQPFNRQVPRGWKFILLIVRCPGYGDSTFVKAQFVMHKKKSPGSRRIFLIQDFAALRLTVILHHSSLAGRDPP